MTLHTLEPTRSNLHGHFSPDLAPVLAIDSGDVMRFRTLDAGWGLERPLTDGGTRRLFEPRDPVRDAGHALCGPIAVRGAEPGMTLEVAIETIEPGAWGWTRAGGWKTPVNDRLGVAAGDAHMLVWSIDAVRGTANNQHGHTVAIRPFMGVLGMPPPESGIHSTVPPRVWGGNLDCKELVPGSRLFLPIPVRGALFSAGDAHAAQGDGEVSGLAIECPVERVDLRLTLRPDLALRSPRAETPAGTLTFGFGDTLDAAAAMALDVMLDVIEARFGVERKVALGLASVVVDLRVTQIVNQVVGVHAVLPKDALGRRPREES